MRTEKVISNYKDLSDDELAVLAGKILGALTDNANFPDPIPALVDLTTVVNDYRTKHEIAIRGGSVLDKRLKNESRKQLLYEMGQLAHHVNTVSAGNLAVLTSSAMILAKQPSGKQVPYTILRVTLKDGSLSGQMRVDFTAQKSIWEYEIQIGEWPNDAADIIWGQSYFTTTSRGNIVAPLTPGTRYYVRVRARNAKGSSDWTEAVSMIVR
ncbi:fibronectin type III domain-containing protein [Sphingobacterium pedocola]|uniref:Fibronectin type-III domain-containing protein n=1 Tax=Sphingobacterium pedocola TaxID=2082722 RepID=A0ABR9T6D6_9SPHI|nr:fibronectin type III domain-containing protein [Sphingobacterium pedocola]MBE8720881.1 hypothetical protein [Sphingobacterium pedocola]